MAVRGRDDMLLMELLARQSSAELTAHAAGRALDRAAGIELALGLSGPPVPVAAPRQRGRHSAKGARGLRALPGVAAACAALRLSWHAHAPALAKVALARTIAHPVVASLAALTITGGVVTGVAVVPSTASAHEHPPAASASLPGWHTVGVPITVPPPVDALAVHPKPKLDAKSSAPAPFLPWWLSDPNPPSPTGPSQQASSQPSQAPASPAAPPVLAVSETALDLTSVSSETVTLTAEGGSGWLSWRVAPGGTDLDFSATHGVLAAGQSYTLTVSLDSAQDGLPSQAFSVNGTQVTVVLPALPAVVPSGAVPSPAGSDDAVPSPAAS